MHKMTKAEEAHSNKRQREVFGISNEDLSHEESEFMWFWSIPVMLLVTVLLLVIYNSTF